MLKQLISSQNGFSIVQGILIAGAVAGMGYVGTRMIQDQKLAENGIESRNNLEQLHDMVYSILQNKDNCTATIFAESLQTDAVWSSAANQAMTGVYTRNAASPSSPAKVFEINNSATYDGSKSYMNNSVTIDSMTLIKPAGLNFANPASIEIVYRKLDSSGNKRLGQGYGGQTLKKSLPLKIQRNVAGNAFESCYAVSTGDTDQLSKDFCEQIGQSDGNPATADSMFTWDADHQQCVFKDLKCPVGQVFSGIDSTGARRCHLLQNWTSFPNLIDSTAAACNPATATSVSFVQVGDKVKIQCNTNSCYPTPSCPTPWGANLSISHDSGDQSATWPFGPAQLEERQATYANGSGPQCVVWARNSSTCTSGFRRCIYENSTNLGCTGGPASPPPTSCSSSCDCPNPMDVCERGSCVDRSRGCTDGTYSRGDRTCQFLCNGGMWSCPASGAVCGGGSCQTQESAQVTANSEGATGCTPATLDDCRRKEAESGGTWKCYEYDTSGRGAACDAGLACQVTSCLEMPDEASRACVDSGGVEEGHLPTADCESRAATDPSNLRCIKFQRSAGCSMASLCRGGSGGSCSETKDIAAQACRDAGGTAISGYTTIAECQAAIGSNPRYRCLEFKEAGRCGWGLSCSMGIQACCPRTGSDVADCASECADDRSGVNLCSAMVRQCY